MMIAIPQTEYKKQISTMRSWLNGKEFHLALKAFEFAQKYHNGIRKDGVSPEFSHQMFIANYAMSILPGLMYKEETLAAIFLHDICEDYDVTFKEVEERFGPKIAKAVELLTKKLPGEVINPEDKIERNKKYYDALATDPIASVAKGLDRAHNILTMKAARWTMEKQKQYLSEAIDLALPMLKKARRDFPEQRLAYENIKSLILIQAQHISFNLELMKKLEDKNTEEAVGWQKTRDEVVSKIGDKFVVYHWNGIPADNSGKKEVYYLSAKDTKRHDDKNYALSTIFVDKAKLFDTREEAYEFLRVQNKNRPAPLSVEWTADTIEDVVIRTKGPCAVYDALIGDDEKIEIPIFNM